MTRILGLVLAAVVMVGCGPAVPPNPLDAQTKIDYAYVVDAHGQCLKLDGYGKYNDIHVVHPSKCGK
jgi:hypothetical protein